MSERFESDVMEDLFHDAAEGPSRFEEFEEESFEGVDAREEDEFLSRIKQRRIPARAPRAGIRELTDTLASRPTPTQARPSSRSRPLWGPSAATPRVLTYSTKDVIDNRLSVPAQHSLVRLSRHPGTSADAVGILKEVKAGRLAGIYCVNWTKPTQRALKFGGNWWTVIARGEDAVLMLDPDNLSGGRPLVAFRRDLDPDCGLLSGETNFKRIQTRLDAALLRVWQTYLQFHRGEIVLCSPSRVFADQLSGEPTVPPTCRLRDPCPSALPEGNAALLRWVQTSLRRALRKQLPVTGAFDASTQTATRSFQRRVGMLATGELNANTFRALQQAAHQPAPCLPGACVITVRIKECRGVASLPDWAPLYSDAARAVQQQLQLYFTQVVNWNKNRGATGPKSILDLARVYVYGQSIRTWDPSDYPVRGFEEHDLVVYLLTDQTQSLIVREYRNEYQKAHPGEHVTLGAAGTTLDGSKGVISEVYLDNAWRNRDPVELANLIFHELMHNKLHLGEDLHDKCSFFPEAIANGTHTARRRVTVLHTKLTDCDKDLIAPVLHHKIRQYYGRC